MSEILKMREPFLASQPAGYWVPACGGTEKVFRSRSGIRLLYCWNPVTGAHAYINVDTDIVLTQAEADAVMMIGG